VNRRAYLALHPRGLPRFLFVWIGVERCFGMVGGIFESLGQCHHE
jgi:hypothetical protein